MFSLTLKKQFLYFLYNFFKHIYVKLNSEAV